MMYVRVNLDRWMKIFNRQQELMGKVRPIEAKNTGRSWDAYPLDINGRDQQVRLKDGAWRITEEWGEVADCFINNESQMRAREEAIDVLHFLVEFSILAGWEVKKIDDTTGMMPEYPGYKSDNWKELIFEAHLHLARACHELKNRPWKQTHTDTDRSAFFRHLNNSWGVWYFFATGWLGMSDEDIFEAYWKKSSTNLARWNNGY